MKILVAVKQVAALDEDFEIREDGRDVQADFLIRDLNEWDDFSLEEAVKIKEASSEPVEVIAVSVGPEEADESLRKCLAKGADRAIRVWDCRHRRLRPDRDRARSCRSGEARGTRHAVRRRAILRSCVRLDRNRRGGLPRLAARGRGELA